MRTLEQPTGFELGTHVLGPLPIINRFWERLGVGELLNACLPHDDPRTKLAPATTVGVVVRNLVLGHQPVYALAEWAAAFDPALLGLGTGEVGLLNDDRIGRVLGQLFDVDRASLLTRLALRAIGRFGLDTSQLHNDSTSITFAGAYAEATGTPRGGKPTPAITWGHNKDHRPDLKQLVWVLTVTADGAVPISCRVTDGNTADDTTHIDTWDGLVAPLGRSTASSRSSCSAGRRSPRSVSCRTCSRSRATASTGSSSRSRRNSHCGRVCPGMLSRDGFSALGPVRGGRPWHVGRGG